MKRNTIAGLLASLFALCTAWQLASAQNTTRPTLHIDPATATKASADPLAALGKPKASDSEMVTVITSERLFYDYKQKFALFQTNVVVVDPRIKITADQMTVFFDESNHVSAIKCEHHVKISQEDKTATSDLATYDVRTGDIILTGGKPEVVSGSNFMTGDPIIFNRDNNTINVPGTVERPRIRIMPGTTGGPSVLDAAGGKTSGNKPAPGGKEKTSGNKN